MEKNSSFSFFAVRCFQCSVISRLDFVGFNKENCGIFIFWKFMKIVRKPWKSNFTKLKNSRKILQRFSPKNPPLSFLTIHPNKMKWNYSTNFPYILVYSSDIAVNLLNFLIYLKSFGISFIVVLNWLEILLGFFWGSDGGGFWVKI